MEAGWSRCVTWSDSANLRPTWDTGDVEKGIPASADEKGSLACASEPDNTRLQNLPHRKLIYQICPKARKKWLQLTKLYHREEKETFRGSPGLKGTKAKIYGLCLTFRALKVEPGTNFWDAPWLTKILRKYRSYGSQNSILMTPILPRQERGKRWGGALLSFIFSENTSSTRRCLLKTLNWGDNAALLRDFPSYTHP